MSGQRTITYTTVRGVEIEVETAPHRPGRSAVFSMGSIVLGSAGLVAIFGFKLMPPLGTLFVLGVLSQWLARRSRRLVAEQFDEALDLSRSAQVLYLRSFRDDREVLVPTFFGWDQQTHEERVCNVFRQLGQVVAIGRPGESLPLLGAVRLYVADEHWRAVALDLMARSRAVIFQMGATTGLQWELGQLIQRVEPTRLVLFLTYHEVPRDSPWSPLFRPLRGRRQSARRLDRYARFRRWAQYLMRKPLPDQIGDSCFIYFDGTWTPHILGPEGVPDPPPGTGQHATSHPLAPILNRIARDGWLQPVEPDDDPPPGWALKRALARVIIVTLILIPLSLLTMLVIGQIRWGLIRP